jgi:hypothetical protein
MADRKIWYSQQSRALKAFSFTSHSVFTETRNGKIELKREREREARQLILSHWNPVPSARHFRGDLLYIVLIACKDLFDSSGGGPIKHHITATHCEFYLNASKDTVFRPDPDPRQPRVYQFFFLNWCRNSHVYTALPAV